MLPESAWVEHRCKACGRTDRQSPEVMVYCPCAKNFRKGILGTAMIPAPGWAQTEARREARNR